MHAFYFLIFPQKILAVACAGVGCRCGWRRLIGSMGIRLRWLWGFALMDSPTVTRAQLLAVKKMMPEVWRVGLGGRIMKMMPFTAIEDQEYATYLRVT